MLLSKWLDIEVINDIEVGGVCLDSRQTKPGDAFIALNGPHYNAEQFIPQAIEQGAVVVLKEGIAQRLEHLDGVFVLTMPNLENRVSELAAKLYAYPSRSMRVVAITGTNGKTSCSVFMAQALAKLDKKVAVIGTLGYGQLDNLQSTGMTTPDPARLQAIFAELRGQGIETVVMEVSSHALDQGRVEGVEFEVVLFTNLTQDHLDYHGTMAAYAKAKRRLLYWPGVKGFAINVDDQEGRNWLQRAPESVQVCAVSLQAKPQSQYFMYVERAQCLATGMQLDLVSSWGQASITLPLLGRFNVSNVALVVAGLCLFKESFKATVKVVQTIQPVPGRMQILHRADSPVVVVDFAHTPDALAQVLTTLRELCKGRLICVFGCGGDRDRAKRPLMAQATVGLANCVIATNDNPRTESPAQIIADIMPGFSLEQQVLVEENRAVAIKQAIVMASEQDIVLIAGKGHETEQIIGDERLPFSDVDEAKKVLGSVYTYLPEAKNTET